MTKQEEKHTEEARGCTCMSSTLLDACDTSRKKKEVHAISWHCLFDYGRIWLQRKLRSADARRSCLVTKAATPELCGVAVDSVMFRAGNFPFFREFTPVNLSEREKGNLRV